MPTLWRSENGSEEIDVDARCIQNKMNVHPQIIYEKIVFSLVVYGMHRKITKCVTWFCKNDFVWKWVKYKAILCLNKF